MASLDELLLESGAMTEAQLAIVRKEQEASGGSLDANILALGYLTEPALQRLIRRLWSQGVEVDYKAPPSKDALALITKEDAERIGAVPIAVTGSQLTVYLHQRANLGALGELDSLSDFDLVGVGLNEVRLRYLLDEHYGIAREPRYVEIMDRIFARTKARDEAPRSTLDSLIGDPMAGLEPDMLAGAMVVERPGSGQYGMADDDLEAEVIPILEDELLIEVTDEDEEIEEEADAGQHTLEEEHQTLAAEDFTAALDELTSMDGIPDIFFRFGVPFFKSVALFKVQSNMVMGWRGAGLGIVSELIRGIVVPVQSDTFLARGIEESPYAGQAGSNAVEERIAEQLGASGEAHVVTAAVKVGDRPVLVVCGLAEQEAPAEAVVSQIGQLCDLASKTVLRIIMDRKKAKVAAEDDTEQSSADEPPKKKAPKKKASKKKASKKKTSKK